MIPFALSLFDGAQDAMSEQLLIATAIGAAVLLGFGMLQIPLGRRMSRWLGPAPEPASGVFDVVDLFAAILLYFGGIVFAGAGAGLLFTGELFPEPEFFDTLGAREVLVTTVVGQLPVVAYIVIAAVRRPGGLGALGVRDLTPGPRTRYTIARYLVGLPMVFGLGSLTAVIYLANGLELPQQDAARLISESLATDAVAVVLLSVVLIPLVEEIMFRGFLLEFITEAMGRVGGIVLSSAIFAWLHGVEVFLPIFGLAVILAIVKLRTRSLGAAWLVHAMHNGSSTAILYISTQAFPEPL